MPTPIRDSVNDDLLRSLLQRALPPTQPTQDAGPEGTSTMDARLAALRSNQQPELEPKKEEPSSMLPATLAQLLDLTTTEDALGQNGAPQRRPDDPHIYPVRTYEANPLPGMQSSVGRLLWAGVENQLADRLTRSHPRARIVVNVALPLIHGLLAIHNQRLASDAAKGLVR